MRAATRRAKDDRLKPAPAKSKTPAHDATLSDKAYQAILKGLFDRTIPVGTDLSQAELIRLLGITAQPLRDALRTLENEGLVTIHARSGIRFVRADLELSRSTYQFRSLIERAGASTAPTFSLGMTQSELAEELGTVREVIVRALRQLKDMGAISSRDNGRFAVVDAALLKEAADVGA